MMERAGLWCALVLLGGLVPGDATARSGPATATLVRGGCFGPCPEYEVVVADDGTVRFLGLDHVSLIGQTEYSVPRRRARAIVRRASRFDFAALARLEPEPCITDMRQATVIVDDGLAPPRMFFDDHGCRSPAHARARRLERAIDRVTKARRYELDRRSSCAREHDDIHYQGDDDIEVRAEPADEPYARWRGEVLDRNIGRLRADPSLHIDVWTMGRPSDAQQRRLDAYAEALVLGGIERERITIAMLPGSGGSKLGALADSMVRIAITSGECRLLR